MIMIMIMIMIIINALCLHLFFFTTPATPQYAEVTMVEKKMASQNCMMQYSSYQVIDCLPKRVMGLTQS